MNENNDTQLKALNLYETKLNQEVLLSEKLCKKYLNKNFEAFKVHHATAPTHKTLGNTFGGFWIGDEIEDTREVIVATLEKDEHTYTYSASPTDGSFTINYAAEITLIGESVELTIINKLGFEITDYDHNNMENQSVKVWIFDYDNEDNLEGTITIKVINNI